MAYCEPVVSPGAMSVAIEKLLQEETASRACYSMAGCFYKAIVPALSIDKASSWPFNEAGDMRSRLL